MKIEKEKWQEWAAMIADQEINDFSKHVPLTVEQAIILRAKLETCALYGMDLAASMAEKGADLSAAKETKPALMRQASNAGTQRPGKSDAEPATRTPMPGSLE